MRTSPARGRWAEDRACRYLTEKLGFRLEERNVRLAGGEIDLVMRDGEVQVFVEVKARRDGRAAALVSVSADKRRRLAQAAATWLAGRGVLTGGCRFDVVTIEGVGPDTRLHHIRNAFDAPRRFGI